MVDLAQDGNTRDTAAFPDIIEYEIEVGAKRRLLERIMLAEDEMDSGKVEGFDEFTARIRERCNL